MFTPARLCRHPADEDPSLQGLRPHQDRTGLLSPPRLRVVRGRAAGAQGVTHPSQTLNSFCSNSASPGQRLGVGPVTPEKAGPGGTPTHTQPLGGGPCRTGAVSQGPLLVSLHEGLSPSSLRPHPRCKSGHIWQLRTSLHPPQLLDKLAVKAACPQEPPQHTLTSTSGSTRAVSG